MWSSTRPVVAMLAVLLCAALAAAKGPGIIGATAQEAPDQTTGSAGPMRSSRPLLLTDEERYQVHRGLARFPDVGSKATLGVSDQVPRSAPLEDLPANVTADIPLLRGHKFLKLEDRILLVEPARRVVVAMIPRYKLLP